MKSGHVLHPQEITPIDRGKGIRSIPLVGPQVDSETLLTGISSFPPGTEIALHTHNRDECVVVLEGQGFCEVGGSRHEVKPFDTTFAPAGVEHRFVNTGEGDMRILWVYAGIDTTRTYVETGETAPQLARFDQH